MFQQRIQYHRSNYIDFQWPGSHQKWWLQARLQMHVIMCLKPVQSGGVIFLFIAFGNHQKYMIYNTLFNRPISPHLSIYKLQKSSNLSILHRFSGLFLCLLFISALCLFDVYDNLFCKVIVYLLVTYSVFIFNSILFFLILIYLYHLISGVRFILFSFYIVDLKN